MLFIRICKFWLHPQFIYKHTDVCKREIEARKALIWAEQIMKNIRESQMESFDDADGKPKNFIRALMSVKNKLSDVAIKDEINSLLLAVNIH
jgi:hypothetical protein